MEKYEIPEPNSLDSMEGVFIEKKEERLENFEEIKEKIVDIFEEKDLKYKQPFDPVSLFTIVERGLISGEVLAPTSIEMKKKWNDVKDRPRQEAKNNVFYPHRSFNLLCNFVNNEIEDTTKKESFLYDDKWVYFSELNSSLLILKKMLLDKKILIKEEDLKEIVDIIDNILLEIRNGDNKIETKKIFVLKSFLDNHKDDIANLWNKKFFLEAEEASNLDTSKPYEGYDIDTNLIGYSYTFGMAYIISPKVPVVPSRIEGRGFASDYPTESIIDTMRVSPRNIIGIIINRKKSINILERFSEKKFDLSLDIDHIDFLRNTEIKKTIEDKRETTFLLSYVHKYSESYLKDFLTKNEKMSGNEIDELFNFLENKNTNYNYDSDKLDKFHKIALDFFSQYDVLNTANTLWDLIENIAKKTKIPIYDTQGNLLWPAQMSHEEIVKMKEDSKEED